MSRCSTEFLVINSSKNPNHPEAAGDKDRISLLTLEDCYLKSH